MATFYIVRHGQTQYNIEMIMQGWVNSDLTQIGRAQARKVGHYLQDVTFNRCISSDLGRAMETSKLILEGTNTPIIADQRVREVCFGKYDGGLIADVPIKDYRKRIEYNWVEFGGETYDSVGNRFASCLNEYAKNYPNDTMLVTSHGGAIISMIKHYDYSLYDSMVSVENKIRNCSTTILTIEENGRAKFKLVNFDAYMHE